MGELARRHGARVMLAALLASLGAGLALPVYTDEVGWRFQLARFVPDGGVDRFVAEGCGANTVAVPPFFMVPVRVLGSWWADMGDTPLAVRITGVACAIAGVLLLRATIRTIEPAGPRRALLETVAYALLGLGVLPFLLVWSRPEQPIWLALLVATLAVLRRLERTGGERPGAILVVMLAGLAAISFHLKGLFYLPLFLLLVAGSSATATRWRWRPVAMLMLAGAAALAIGYWRARLACPADPRLAAMLARENIASRLSTLDWPSIRGVLPTIVRNATLTPYVALVEPAEAYLSDWLPRNALPLWAGPFWAVFVAAAWYGSGLVTLVALGLSAWRRRFDWRGAAAAALLLGMVAWSATQINRNDYEAALIFPAATLVLVLALAGWPRWPGWIERGAIALAGISLVSQTALLVCYLPAMLRASETPGYLNHQIFSIPTLGYPAVAPQVTKAARLCRIDPRHARGVLIDDLTYFTFVDSYRPFHRTGVLSTWNGSINDPAAWLRRHGSDGVVLGCRYLSPSLRARASVAGDICCLRLDR